MFFQRTYDARRTNRLPSIVTYMVNLLDDSSHTTSANPPMPVPFALPTEVVYHSYNQPQRDVFY
jgi:hypothetical protein